MTVAIAAGTPQHADVDGALPPSSRAQIDAGLAELARHKDQWARLPVRDRRAILGELRKDFAAVAPAWAAACLEAEGLPPASPAAGEEWLVGPYFILRNLRLLEEALDDIDRFGQPRIPGPVKTLASGQVSAQVFPQTSYDRLFYAGVTGEVRMQPGVSQELLAGTQAVAYKRRDPAGEVVLVLGAGNVSSIGPMDALYALFVENKVVVYKMHPLNAYLGPILEKGFQALLDWGVLRIVYGGAEEGSYLCEHAAVGAIHVTGSDKTVEAIVFGPGEEGALRKRQKRPKLEKTVSSELGNVSPVIVVPGPWEEADVAYHAESLAAMLTNNAGFNCNAARVIVQHAAWPERQLLLDRVRSFLARVAPRKAYYPGARERWQSFVEAHPDAETFGGGRKDELPWTLIPGIDPEARDEICFRTEAFCGVFAETVLEAGSIAEFVDKAAAFANERLWGTLNATLLVHPASLDDPAVAAAVERAIADLRYGTVAINNWAAIGYGLVSTPWGAFPGHDVYDIQSGTGVVHNTLMFSRVEKTVVRTPFRMKPKPLWFPTHKTALGLCRKLTDFEADPSPLKLPGIFWEALRG